MLKLLVTLAVLFYTLYPFDLIPDTIFGIGWLDDMITWILLWWFYYRKPGEEKIRQKFEEKMDDFFKQSEDKENPPSSDPYRILGVSKDASKEEIQKAYRQLANKYHPDKVSHLGEEFRTLAEKRFKEIQQSYQTIMSRYD